MPTLYMTFWSVTMIGAMSLWRLRNLRRMLAVLVITAVILLFSQTLFVQLSINAGLDPSAVLTEPARFLASGPIGWLALLVMPCGWLGPIIGLNLVQRIEASDQ
ncbi:MAG: hypothetical protein H6662_12915 [Ardenticatenaceae bacterium]|nr:hypothetical protein [Anaerolineales bacterium]MCB8922480.1 hypothetical protein [Ardenticatenaceae bacterium]MCB8989949.1 hypothetical protein [Ardenticatenaceae bacterium]MCB9005392.1 hypothetical protein [Ardenticatenaceae bacterium]